MSSKIFLTLYISINSLVKALVEGLVVTSLKAKPLSMQSAIDWAVMDFVQCSTTASTSVLIYFITKLWDLTLPHLLSLLVALAGHFSLIGMPFFFFVCTLLRFLAVFHLDTPLESVSDHVIHQVGRLAVVSLTMGLVGLTTHFDGSPRFFNELAGLADGPSEKATTASLALTVVTAGGASVVMLILIQREKQFLGQDSNEESKLIRWTLIGTLASTLTPIFINAMATNGDSSGQSTLMMATAVPTVVAIVYTLNNPRHCSYARTHVWQPLRRRLCSNRVSPM